MLPNYKKAPLLAFVGIYLVITSEWPLLSHRLLWLRLLECWVTGELIGLISVGVTTHEISDDEIEKKFRP